MGIQDAWNMTAKELKSALSELGWKGADLARQVHVSENSVSAWRTGSAKVPGPVRAYLEAMLDMKRMVGKWRL